MKERIIALLLSLTITLSYADAQSYETPEYSFQQFELGDTIDIYANDTLTINYFYNNETGVVDGWEASIELDNELKARNTGSSFVITSKTAARDTIKTHEVKVTLTNSTLSWKPDTIVSESKVYYVRVYPKPYARIQILLCDSATDTSGYVYYAYMDQERDTVDVGTLFSYNTHAVRFLPPTLPGDKSTWDCLIDNDTLPKYDTYQYVFKDEDAEYGGKEHTFKIVVRNKLKYRKEEFCALANINFIIYPIPTAGYYETVDTYSGVPANFCLHYEGGIPDLWMHEWRDEQMTELTDEQMTDITYVTDTLITKQYYLYIQNGNKTTGYYYGADWLTLNVWPQASGNIDLSYHSTTVPYYEETKTFLLECYEGDCIDINYHVNGGFIIQTDDSWVIMADSTEYLINEYPDGLFRLDVTRPEQLTDKNTDDDGSVWKYVDLSLINRYTGDGYSPDSVWMRKDYRLIMKIWLKADYSSDFEMIDKNQNRSISSGFKGIRKGNTLITYTDSIAHGYQGQENSIIHVWKVGNEIFAQSIDSLQTVVTMNNSMEKATAECNVGLKIQNMNSYGTVWTESDYITHTITTYNKPNTPTRLTVKGNGTSATLIAMSDVSDANMALYDYYIVFGYTNKNGEKKEKANAVVNGEIQRYTCSFSQEELTDTTNVFYVYSQWCYDDGVTITSGKRYTDMVDEEWDGSDYSGNGGTIRLVRSTFANHCDTVTDKTDNPTEYYYLNGVQDGTKQKGLRIVRYSDGATRKVIVK